MPALPNHLCPRREKIFGPAPGIPLDRNAKVRIKVYVQGYNGRHKQPRSIGDRSPAPLWTCWMPCYVSRWRRCRSWAVRPDFVSRHPTLDCHGPTGPRTAEDRLSNRWRNRILTYQCSCIVAQPASGSSAMTNIISMCGRRAPPYQCQKRKRRITISKAIRQIIHRSCLIEASIADSLRISAKFTLAVSDRTSRS